MYCKFPLHRFRFVNLSNIPFMLITHYRPPPRSTDAVFRYLLVRYGFHPTQASGLKDPLQIGDVMYVEVPPVLVITINLLIALK